jgi:nicotinate-nucleotide adenylyltransferase
VAIPRGKTAPVVRGKPKPLRLGLYGGTFDPVHHGHLLGARDALEQFRLDAVVWIPCARSPHKTAAAAPGAERLALLRRAVKGWPDFWVSPIELRRKGPSYAVDTAAAFAEALPGAELFCLIGADQLPGLATWERYAELRRRVTFIVLDRPGCPPVAGRQLPAGVISLPRPRRIDISATEIRRRVKQHLPIDALVPAPVASHIARRGLYR